MKKTRVIVLLCIVSSFMTGHVFAADWSAMISGTTNNLNGVWGSSGSNVFAVGDSGTILHYDGTAWSSMASSTTNNLNEIWGSSDSHAFAVGDNGTILHYDGLNWLTAQSNTTNNLNGIWGSSSSYADAVGDNGTFLYYNGSWSIPMPPGTFPTNLNAVWGISSADLFVVGDGGTIGHFGGIPGGFMDSGTTEKLNDVWGSSSSAVYAVGTNGTFLIYNGVSWSAPMAGVFTYNFNAIWGSSGSDIFVVCDDGAIGHFGGSPPGGPMDSGTTEHLYDVWGSSGSNVFAVGANGTILHYSPPSCVSVNPPSAYQGQIFDFTIIGSNTNFIDTGSTVDSTTVSFSCSGITVNSTTVNTPTKVTANITIAPNAPAGYCNVTVITGSEVVSCGSAFTIKGLAPANDDFDNATPITVPFIDSIDTSGATSAADDPTDCYGTNASVWYEFTPGSNIQIQVDSSYSNYDTVVAVYTGTLGSLNLIACWDSPCFTLDAFAGETYYFMVTSYSGMGGALVFSVDVASPPLSINLTLNASGLTDKAGVATISGVLTCSQPAYAAVAVQARQKAGRVFITGESSTYFDCDGATPWQVQVYGDIGSFFPGKVSVRSIAQGCSDGYVCGYNNCVETPEVDKTVQLKTSQPTTTVPQSTSTAPKTTTTVPQSTSTAPKTTTTVPQSTSTAPSTTTTGGSTTTTVPVTSTSVPSTTTISIPPDRDGDGVPDAIDNCPDNCNTMQLDADRDGIGDVCDPKPGCGKGKKPACENPC